MRYFAFSLARELGMTVEQLLRTISIAELIEWQSFIRIERQEYEKRRAKTDAAAESPGDIDLKVRQAFSPYTPENPAWRTQESQ